MSKPRCIPSPSLDVVTSSGTARGWRGPVAAHWSAIPYAQQPTSMEMRFSSPVPFSSSDTFDAVLPARIPLHEEKNHTDLTLSVCAPADLGGAGNDRSQARCPVVVYLHGGRFEHGHADEPIYRGDAFARDGVVYVSVNYRKRFDGFLPSQPPRGSEENDRSYHPHFRGVEDVICALRWVKRNIAGFGGDPDQVLAIGQSAGGGLLAYVLTCPEVMREELVHRAMIMSPGLPRSGWSRRARLAEVVLRSASSNTKDWVHGLTEEKLTQAYQTFAKRYSSDIATGPYPLRVDRMADIPLLVTGLAEEFDQFPLAKWADKKALGNAGEKLMSKGVRALAAKAVGAPLAAIDPAVSAGRVIGDSTILRFVSQILERERGGRTAPQWGLLYRGGGHCADIPLVFDALGSDPAFARMFCGRDAQARLQTLADDIHRMVVGFARGNQLGWQTYGSTRSMRVVELPSTPPTATAPREAAGSGTPSDPREAAGSGNSTGVGAAAQVREELDPLARVRTHFPPIPASPR